MSKLDIAACCDFYRKNKRLNRKHKKQIGYCLGVLGISTTQFAGIMPMSVLEECYNMWKRRQNGRH